MKVIAALTILLVAQLGNSQATPSPLTLAAAQSRAGASSPSVALAAERLQAARDDQHVVELDPYSVRIDQLRAQQAVELATSRLLDSHWNAVEDVTTAYMAALVARAAVQTSDLEEQVADIRAAAAEARFAAGAITSLDLQAAERNQVQAATTVANANNDLQAAIEHLSSLLLIRVDQNEIGLIHQTPDVPELQTLLSAVERNTAAVAARHTLDIAIAQRHALHPSLHSRRVISEAEAAIEEAKRALEAARKQESDRLTAAHAAGLRAGQALQLAQESREVASQRLEIERTRFQNGLSAKVDVLEAQLAVARAEASEIIALREYILDTLPLDRASELP